MSSISFKLVTPERTVLSEELVSLSCPTEMGEITVLPNHVPLVATLKAGELHAKNAKQDFYLHVSGGFIEVRSGSEVIVLADSAAHHYEIDVEKEEQAKARAEQAMREEHLAGEEYAKVSAVLERSLGRLNVARKHAHRKTPGPNLNNLE